MKRISLFSFLIGTLFSAGTALADDPWLASFSQADLNQKAHAACVEKSPLGNGSDACTQSIQTCVNAYRQHIYSVCSSYEDYYGDDYYNCKQSFLDGAADVAKTHHGNIGLNCSLISQTWPTSCGNGAKEGSEACDDGNQVDNDACSNSCMINLLIVPITVDIVPVNPPANPAQPVPAEPNAPSQPAPIPNSGGTPGDSTDTGSEFHPQGPASNASGGGCALGISTSGSFASVWIALLALILPGAVQWNRKK